MVKIRPNQLVMLAAVVVLVYLLFSMNSKKSKYSVQETMYAPSLYDSKDVAPSTCQMKAGTGLASSLLPREVASQEDFGEFAPEDILKGQNFLDPRQQIGFPETTGGALRNANQQIRADPPNPKDAFVWNNSTIAPDLMQRSLCA